MSEGRLSEEKSVEMLAQEKLIKQILISQYDYIRYFSYIRSRLKTREKGGATSSSVHYEESGERVRRGENLMVTAVKLFSQE